MKTRTLTLAAALLCAPMMLAVPAQAEGVSMTATAPVVDLNIYESIDSKPDMASFSVGVESRGATAEEALNANSMQMAAVLKAVKAYKVADKDVQTSNISVQPNYDYNQDGPPKLIGYIASNQVTVKVRKLPDLGKIIDAATKAGATNVNGPWFSLNDDSAVKAEARKKALDKAKAQAVDYARWAGYRDVRLIWVSESMSQGGGFQPMPMPMMEMAAAKMAVPPIEAGQVTTGVSVSVKFEMVK